MTGHSFFRLSNFASNLREKGKEIQELKKGWVNRNQVTKGISL
jgi:hypothetical protein